MISSKIISLTTITMSLLTVVIVVRGLHCQTYSEGAYIVEWSDNLKHGAMFEYNVTKTDPNLPDWILLNTTITIIVDKLPNEVNNGFTGKNYCKAINKLANYTIKSNEIPPVILPEYVFRVCCNAYKKITYQMKNWGWGNFTLLTEGENIFTVRYTDSELESTIRFLKEGIAYKFEVKLFQFNKSYSCDLMTNLSTNNNSNTSNTVNISLSSIFTAIFILHEEKKRSNKWIKYQPR